jgi:SAM-dependent methyltransferase
MHKEGGVALLDVRDEAAFAAGHASGAANIPLEEFQARAHELPPKGVPVRIYDADPRRARAAVEALRDRGYAARKARLAPADLRRTGPSEVRLWRPSPFLVEALKRIALLSRRRKKRGRAADLACGSGREAVYLALSGCAVDAIDILPDALARARALARRADVRIRTIRKDLEREPVLPVGRYDLVTVFRFLHRPLLAAIGRSIAPGGFVVYETFNRRDRPRGRRPLKAAHTVRDGELAAAFGGFDVLIARDGARRRGRRFSQLLARRPRGTPS